MKSVLRTDTTDALVKPEFKSSKKQDFKPGNLLRLTERGVKHYGYSGRSQLRFSEPILLLKRLLPMIAI